MYVWMSGEFQNHILLRCMGTVESVDARKSLSECTAPSDADQKGICSNFDDLVDTQEVDTNHDEKLGFYCSGFY